MLLNLSDLVADVDLGEVQLRLVVLGHARLPTRLVDRVHRLARKHQHTGCLAPGELRRLVDDSRHLLLGPSVGFVLWRQRFEPHETFHCRSVRIHGVVEPLLHHLTAFQGEPFLNSCFEPRLLAQDVLLLPSRLLRHYLSVDLLIHLLGKFRVVLSQVPERPCLDGDVLLPSYVLPVLLIHIPHGVDRRPDSIPQQVLPPLSHFFPVGRLLADG